MSRLENLSENIASEIRDAEENARIDTELKMQREQLKTEEKRIDADVSINNRLAERDENIAEMQLGVQEYRSMFQEMFDKLNGLLSNNVSTTQSAPDINIETTPVELASEDTPPTIPEEIEEPEQIPEEIGADLSKETNEVKEEINGEDRKRGRKSRRRR